MTQYRTYNFYTPKGNRLTIVGEQKDNNIEVTVIPCSLKDHFSKKIGMNLYNAIKSGANTKTSCTFVNIPGDSPKDFIRWCRGKFKRVATYGVSGDILKVYKSKKLSMGFTTHLDILV